MIFNEWTYAAFLALALVGFSLLPQRARAAWLMTVGALFYAFYGGLWLVVFIAEIVISRFYEPKSRVSLWGIAQAVAILALVKYGPFLVAVASDISVRLGGSTLGPVAQIPLPLGLSFFVFEFVHYAADRYFGRAEKQRLVDYGAFILFFPTMIAGPIKRIQGFAPSLANARVNGADLWFGLQRIAIGLCKKAILADNLSNLIEGGFTPNVPHEARYATLVFRIVVYSFRIYFDFSAYSDIAIGSARLFGIHVPENFNWPYLAKTPSEFWRRWHISLSRWITDYLFIPFGGSRGTRARTIVATLAAMTLSGLWHGAAWNFVIWGAYHAVLLVAYRGARPIWQRVAPLTVRESRPMQLAYIAGNFALVTYGWIFFAMPIGTALPYALRLAGISR